VAKAADTPTAGDPDYGNPRARFGTPAECCEALVPGTCGDSFDCSGEKTNTKAKAADTATADTPGTPAECCEAPVPGTCGDSFDCSGEAKHTQAKAADTATADTPGTSAECCEAEPKKYVVESSATLQGVTLAVAISDEFKTAFQGGIAEQYSVSSSDVTIGTIVEVRRRLSGGVTIPFTITTTSASSAAGFKDVTVNTANVQAKILADYAAGPGTEDLSGMTVESMAEVQDVEKETELDGGGSATPTAAAGAATATLLLVLFANI